jgi:hypothetical protein
VNSIYVLYIGLVSSPGISLKIMSQSPKSFSHPKQSVSKLYRHPLAWWARKWCHRSKSRDWGTTEAREMILTRDLIVIELRSRSFEFLSVPDDLSSVQTLDWIDTRTRSGDIALEIHADAFPNP